MDEKRSCCCGALPRTRRWLLSLLGLPLIFLLMLGSKQGVIENDLASRSNAALQEAGIDWAQLEASGRGRDMLLRGDAGDMEARDEAIRLVQNVYGVREVQSLIHVAGSGEPGGSVEGAAAVGLGEGETTSLTIAAKDEDQNTSATAGQAPASSDTLANAAAGKDAQSLAAVSGGDIENELMQD